MLLAADPAIPLVAADTLSRTEVAALLAGLGPEEWRVLHRSASILGRRAELSGPDVLQEALLRMLQGSRRCPRHLSFRRSIAGVMRSLVSAELEVLEGERRSVIVPPEMLDGHADEALSPATLAIARRDDAVMIERLMELIEDDQMLVALVDARCDGLQGEALRRHLGVSEKQLATLKRRLARRIAHLLGEFRTPG